MPKISIIIATLNRGHLIGRAIKSVKEQSFVDWELIIVDGGSSDNTKEVIESFNDDRIIIVRQKNTGTSDAINQGVAMAKGLFCALLDDDNYFSEEIFSVVSAILEKNDIDVIYGNAVIINNKNEKIKTYKPPPCLNLRNACKYTTGAIPVQPAVFFKKNYSYRLVDIVQNIKLPMI